MMNNQKSLQLVNLKHISYLLLGFIFFFPLGTFSQKNNMKGKDKKIMHHEIPNDKHVQIPPEQIKTSPAFRSESKGVFINQVNVNEDGENILGDAANEPSIAVDPTNPNRIVIGWRQFDNVNSDFRQAGYAYSLDAGQTWTSPEPIDAGVFRSDPVLDFDSDGNFYYNSLTVDEYNNMTCDVFKIDDGGVEWDDGTFAQGGDKQWMRIDRTEGMGEGHNYSYWTQSWSSCYPGCFTRSTDYGATYEDCVQISGNPHWGTLAVGPDGELYTVGAGQYYGINITKSSNAQNQDETVTWDLFNQIDLDGELTGWTAVNPAGLLGQAWIDVDKSYGPGRGNVYVAASVNRNSVNDPGDVMFTKSTDGGVTWSDPVRINNDVGTDNYQWFGTMSVAPNGRIDIIWLDTRNAPQYTYYSSLYYSFSIDQGETWSENTELSELFNPHLGWPQQEKMGDYYDMVSVNDGAHLAWANTINGEQDVYYAFITPEYVSVQEKNKNIISLSNYPNPFNEKTTIRYKLSNKTNVQINIFDIYGKKIETLINKDQQAGIYNIVFSSGNLSDGIYYCRLSTGKSIKTIPLMLKK